MPFKNDHNLVFTLILRNTKFHDYGYGKQIYFLCCTYKEQDNTYNMCEIEIYTKKVINGKLAILEKFQKKSPNLDYV